MAEPNVLARGVQVEDEVLAAHHRVEEEAGDVLLDLLLLRRRGRLRHQLGLHLQRALGLEEGGVDGEVHLVGSGGLVAVEEGGEAALVLLALSHPGDKYGFAPEVHEGVLDLGRREEEEV